MQPSRTLFAMFPCGRRSAAVLVSLVAVLLVPTPHVAAQSIEITCRAPLSGAGAAEACMGTVPRTGQPQMQRINVRVVQAGTTTAVQGAAVVFRTAGAEVVADTVYTDANGDASTYWHRPRSSDPGIVTVEATGPQPKSPAALRIVRIMPSDASVQIGLERWWAPTAWFEKNPLPGPVALHIFRIDNEVERYITDDETCAAQRVVFARFGNSGNVSPDTAWGAVMAFDTMPADTVTRGSARGDTLRESGSRGCFVSTRWTLGEGPGVRNLRAVLLAGGPAAVKRDGVVELEAAARGLPRLIAGPVFARRRGYYGATPRAERTLRIERYGPDSMKVSYDSTVVTRAAAVDTVQSQAVGAAFFGVSVPAIPTLTTLSVSAGVNMADPLNDWFAGISLVRLFAGVATEGLPVDIHLLGHFGRPSVLRDLEDCKARISCATERRMTWHGLGGMISVDASSLFSDVIKKIIGG